MRAEPNATPWNTGRAMLYGAVIGVVAAGFKSLAPWSVPQAPLRIAEELIGAALAFALLCGVATALRNFVARRLIWPNLE